MPVDRYAPSPVRCTTAASPPSPSSLEWTLFYRLDTRYTYRAPACMSTRRARWCYSEFGWEDMLQLWVVKVLRKLRRESCLVVPVMRATRTSVKSETYVEHLGFFGLCTNGRSRRKSPLHLSHDRRQPISWSKHSVERRNETLLRPLRQMYVSCMHVGSRQTKWISLSPSQCSWY